MDFFAIPPLAALLDLAYRALVSLTALLDPLAGSASAACAIVLTTLAVRVLLIPLGVMQARADRLRARLAPRLRLLQERHRRDPERLQRETMRLYREEKASPVAGCLPLLVQAPIIGILYAVFLHPVIAGNANALLGHTVWGVRLGDSLAGVLSVGGVDPAGFAVFAFLVFLTALVGELTRRSFRPGAEAPPPHPSAGVLGLLHFAPAVIAAFVPLAAGLYLTVSVAWTLAQRLILRRLYPMDT